MADDPIRDLVTGFIQHRQVEESADYVVRGRAYEPLSDADLADAWINAFKAWAHDFSMRQEMDDYGAELGLREIQPPLDRVPEEWAAVMAKIEGVRPTEDGAEALMVDLEAYAKAKHERSN